MSLNDVDSTGVSQEVIDDMIQWRKWLDNEYEDHYREQFDLSFGWFSDTLTLRNAEYTVQCLQQFLSLEVEHNRRNPQKKKTTKLSLADDFMAYRFVSAITVFCEFLQQPNTKLVALELECLPDRQFRNLLQSLHTNTSVKELNIGVMRNNHDDQCGLWISSLLRERSDFTSFRCGECYFRIAVILPCLRRRHAHLETLEFRDCDIDDEGFPLILEAIRDGDFPVLKNLNFSRNGITSVGLRRLAILDPVVLRRLRKLNLERNELLLNDLETTKLFVRNFLLSDDMALNELCLSFSGEYLPIIVKACESNKNKLQVLGVRNDGPFSQRTRDQLIESIPKMNHLRCLVLDFDFF